MTVYMKSARCFVEATDKRFLKCEAIEFSIRGWVMMVAAYESHVPNIKELLARVNHSANQAESHPVHEHYTYRDEPLKLTWTAAECRTMYLELSRAEFVVTETAYDFWEFMALLVRGLAEDGIVTY